MSGQSFPKHQQDEEKQHGHMQERRKRELKRGGKGGREEGREGREENKM